MTDRRVAVAGTFGPLHDGHRNLLRRALAYGTGGVVVAVTSDAFARASRTRAVPDFDDRRAAVEAAVRDLDEWGRDVEFRELTHEHGIVTDEPTIDALVVSPGTADEVARINETRRDRDFDPIDGIVAPYVLAEDGERISSTRIVNGEIDEHGQPRE
jgi:pantetheine-phosphate adenylyltransferase